MASNELGEKINNLIESDDTENFYSLISEIIEENREYISDLDQNLNEAFRIISDDINESNHEKKMSFICLFFEILISENIDFSNYLQKTFQIIEQNGIYSDENIKRIINICSNATIKRKELFDNLIKFSRNKIEYLYIIFSLVGFKEIIVDNLSENWDLIIDLLDNPEIKSNSNNIKNVLKCLELLINLSEAKFRPYASSALYQALDYLTETDVELQKRSLMIIYSLTKFCDEQLQPLSDNIIDFLKVLQNGNNNEINNLCNTMLKHFNGENEDEENTKKDNSNGNINDNGNENNIDDNDYENKINEDNENNENNDNNINKENEQYYENDEENINENNDNEYAKEENSPKKYVQEEKYKKESSKEYDSQPKENVNDYEEENNENRNNYRNGEDNIDNEEDNKFKYKNDFRNEDRENIRNTNQRRNYEELKKDNYSDYKNNNLNNIDINAIIKKIKDLSDKQIIILDSIEQYKRDTKRIINQKKLKIQALESKIEELKEKIEIEKNKKRNKAGRTNYQMRRKKMNNNRNDYDDEDDQNNDYGY